MAAEMFSYVSTEVESTNHIRVQTTKSISIDNIVFFEQVYTNQKEIQKFLQAKTEIEPPIQIMHRFTYNY